jgi:hypothetical protein
MVDCGSVVIVILGHGFTSAILFTEKVSIEIVQLTKF